MIRAYHGVVHGPLWAAAACALASIAAAADAWKPANGAMLTSWGKTVQPAAAWPEHPRPQMARRTWLNLNGLWEYAIRPRDEGRPAGFEGAILVPFPAESALSGVHRAVPPESALWYRRTFVAVPRPGCRLLLHFEAVDWEATVYVNGREVGTHFGGYDPFALDVTAALKPSGPQEIVVRAWDPTDSGGQPRGKQALKPSDVWFTASSGIWGTVWLEEVPANPIQSVRIVPDLDAGAVRVTVNAAAAAHVRMAAYAGTQTVATATGRTGEPVEMKIPSPRPWSPDDPFLYGLKIGAGDDIVDSYFGLRKIETRPGSDGKPRLFLNGEPWFPFGVFDQGFWPDGLHTPPSDEAVRAELEQMKKVGFNTVRKHVKVEPERWYYWCDRLGLAVWQDIPNGNNPDDPAKNQFRKELQAIVDARRNHPSIVLWNLFNTGWGMFAPEELVNAVRERDPGRLVCQNVGATVPGLGDAVMEQGSLDRPAAESRRASLLGGIGALNLEVPGRVWPGATLRKGDYLAGSQDLEKSYAGAILRARLAAAQGWAGAVYLMWCDIEGELSGLLTYDREVMKIPADRITALNVTMRGPPPAMQTLVACAADGVQSAWRYTTTPPPEQWRSVDFDDAAWLEGAGAFGQKASDAHTRYVATELGSSEVWLRRVVNIDGELGHGLFLKVLHDDDAEVHLNGEEIARLPGWTPEYKLIPIPSGKFRNGRNVLAVYCRNSQGAYVIDAGIVEVK